MPDGLKISSHLFGWQPKLQHAKILFYMMTNLRMVEFESHTEALKICIKKLLIFFIWMYL